MRGNYVLAYVQSCLGGHIPFNDCSPIWHFIVIGVLMAGAAGFLLVSVSLRLRAAAEGREA